MVEHLSGTRFVKSPVWSGDHFTDRDADQFWREMPLALQQIALSELAGGNCITLIQRNDIRNIVLVAFDRGPLRELPENGDLTVHTSHSYGNYCYDGTKCTVEEKTTGCFLAFDDPEWQDESA